MSLSTATITCLAVSLVAPIIATCDAPKTAAQQKKYLPYRKYQPLGATAIGVLVGDAQPVLSTEGRSGPKDQLCFSQDGCSYRWVYVPAQGGKAIIQNLQVPIADGQRHVFPALNMANPQTVAPWGVRSLFTLVEVEVNQGHGSPVNDSFVGTNFKVVEGSKRFPLKVTDTVSRLRKSYGQWQKQNKTNIETAMTRARESALKQLKPTGPRQTKDLMYVTWMTNDETLHVRFRTKITDGHYRYVQGGAPVRPFPLPRPINPKFPPPPGAGKQPPKAPVGPPRAAPVPGGQAPGGIAPPPRFKVKTGTTFGVEFGRTYVVNKNGKLLRTESSAIESFQQNLRLPPGARFPVDPVRPLPVPKRPGTNK